MYQLIATHTAAPSPNVNKYSLSRLPFALHPPAKDKNSKTARSNARLPSTLPSDDRGRMVLCSTVSCPRNRQYAAPHGDPDARRSRRNIRRPIHQRNGGIGTPYAARSSPTAGGARTQPSPCMAVHLGLPDRHLRPPQRSRHALFLARSRRGPEGGMTIYKPPRDTPVFTRIYSPVPSQPSSFSARSLDADNHHHVLQGYSLHRRPRPHGIREPDRA